MPEHQHRFRPRARLMHLLGDQLIRDAGVAVFELVKNAYDADASYCVVRITKADRPDETAVVVEDDGEGMSLDTVTKVWLVPGTEHRSGRPRASRRTPRGRLPLGEKGIGRFAAHKLGTRIKLVTRANKCDEVIVDLDWDELFGQPRFLDRVVIPVVDRPPACFKGRKTGTRIEIRGLRDPWTRGKVRALHRAITSISSPSRDDHNEESGFRAYLELDPDPGGWLGGLLDIERVKELAIFRGHGLIQGSALTYDYEFVPLPAMSARIDGRRLEAQREVVKGSMPEDIDSAKPGRRPRQREVDLEEYGIGPVRFEFHIFDREPMVLELATSDKAGLKAFLDANGGVRVYRGGMRVYDFGEPGNDWLDLGGRRVNVPVRRISNNQLIGAVTLDPEQSAESLIEKTNREGFVENDAYAALRVAVLAALHHLEMERYPDRQRLRRLYSRGNAKAPVVEDLAELRDKLKRRRLLDELGPIVDRVERQFIEVQDRLLTAAGAGLSLTVVLHEVEKVVAEAVSAVDRNADKETIAQLVHRVSEIVDGLTFLVRSSGRRTETASALIRQALFNFDYRFRAHGIAVDNGLDHGDPDFELVCVRRLVVATLANLLDNCIYWLDTKGGGERRIYIGTTDALPEGLAFVVADNGPGFRPQDAPEYLVQPFYSRKPDGMGLGLHISSEVARTHGGQLLFPGHDDIALPNGMTGAVVAVYLPRGVGRGGG